LVSAQTPRRRRNPVGGLPPSIGNGGQITITRCELLFAVRVPADSKVVEHLGAIVLAPSAAEGDLPVAMPFLFQLAKAYSRIRWLDMAVEWRPACGTTTNGIITYGARLMDQAKDGKLQLPASRIAVSALYPVNDHPVWQTSKIRIPAKLLQSRLWYATDTSRVADGDLFDTAPGTLEYGLSVDASTTARVYGEFWVSYRAQLDGCRLSS
jgi:hypothetical protein